MDGMQSRLLDYCTRAFSGRSRSSPEGRDVLLTERTGLRIPGIEALLESLS